MRVSLLNVHACSIDMRGNNKNITIVKYTQNASVVFQESLCCTCKIRGYSISETRVSCLKKDHNVRS